MGRVLHHYVAGGSHYWPIRSGALSARLSDFIAYAHEWPVFFLFDDRRTHDPRGTTEFRVGPAPELRRVITQLHRFFFHLDAQNIGEGREAIAEAARSPWSLRSIEIIRSLREKKKKQLLQKQRV